jgi:Glycosyltransferase family 87
MRDARRWRNLGTAAGAAAATLFAVFDLYQWAVAYASDRFHNDLTFYLAAARIGIAHGWGSIYDLALQQVELKAMGSGITIAELARYISPPPVAWLALPFTLLPYEVAYWTWCGLLVVALVLTWRLAAPEVGRAGVIFIAAAIGFLPVIYGLQLAQPGLFVALGVAGSYALLRAGRPLWSGVALGAIALKPQLAFLVPLALLAAGQRRAFFGSLLALGVLGIGSVVTLGADGVRAYLDRLSFASGVPVNRELTLAYFLGPGIATRAVQAGIGAWSLVLAYRTRRRGVEWPYVCALAGGMLATPYVHLDDLAMLGLAAWIVLRMETPAWTWVYLLAAVLVIEGEPIWGPAPVIAVELGGLLLLSAAAFTRQPAPAAAPLPEAGRLRQPTMPR